MRKNTHRKNAVAVSFLTVHLNVVITPFLNKFDHKPGLHEPRKHGVQREYQLSSDIRKISTRYCSWDRTANPMRVAIEELQLQDLKNIEAVISR